MLANAVRLKLDIIFDRWISKEHRGFVGGRSLLGNVSDVDQEMREVAYETDDGACVSFNLRAAFPSVSQGFLLGLIGMIGLPPEMVRFISALYRCNCCWISARGKDTEASESRLVFVRAARFRL